VSPFFRISPGTEFELADIAGPGKITHIWMGGGISRDYIIRFYWDGQIAPSVECPVAEFFAYGWQKDRGSPVKGPFYQLNSLPVAVNPNRGLNCFWPMPFKGRCRVTVENRGEADYICYYQIDYILQSVPDSIGYFHAQFRQRRPVDYMEEYVILDNVAGCGQYVGTAYFVGLNGADGWWGEGEVKFYLDGDADYPTICGTGTEDYFGGSYDFEVDGRYTAYSTPFMGMYQAMEPESIYDNQRRFSMYRWHIMDPIYFARDIRVTIQDLGWSAPGKYLARRDDLSSVAYWYQNLSEPNFPALPGREELRIV
jgi:hypothetical protein